MRHRKLIVLSVCILIPLVAGWLGGIFTSSSVSDWYLTLQKPGFNPPSWVFGPVWTLLFILMGVSLYFIWSSESKFRKACLWFFGVQLGLNLLWSVFFFGLRSPFYALIEIFILLLFILITLIYSFKIDKKAGWLLVPYLLWVSFAIILNLMIVVLN